jgi:hypothetical protein
MENRATELNADIRRAIEQLANETDAARQSRLFRDYLRTSAAFWDYSWHNQMLIWRQRRDASFVRESRVVVEAGNAGSPQPAGSESLLPSEPGGEVQGEEG